MTLIYLLDPDRGIDSAISQGGQPWHGANIFSAEQYGD
jgi:hypothetical protein